MAYITHQQLADELKKQLTPLHATLNSMDEKLNGKIDSVGKGLNSKIDGISEMLAGIGETVEIIADNMATKKDLQSVEARLDLRIDQLDSKIDGVELRLGRRIDRPSSQPWA